MKRKPLVILMAALLLIGLAAGESLAKWPSKPIQVIVPWPGANDPSTLILTAMSPFMQKELGVPFKVVNKPGGSGVLGANFVARANPDGYTLGIISIGPMITQVLRGKTPYKNQDFKPLGLVWSSPFTLACRGDAPYNNLKELAAYGKKHELKLAHWGLGAVPTLVALKAAQIGGFKWKETAYRKLNPLLVVKGDADVITFSITPMRDYVESGKMKLLACILPERLAEFPKTPTVAEQGFGDTYSIWFGLFAPKNTKDAITQKVAKAFFKVMKEAKVREVIKKVGSVPHPIGAERARKQMDSELKNFGALLKEVGVIK